MTSAKYISQSFFSSNSNPGYSGFALWQKRALRSPEIAIAHLSQGLRSYYHGERASFEFLSPQYARHSWCPVCIGVWGVLGVVLPQGPWHAKRSPSTSYTTSEIPKSVERSNYITIFPAIACLDESINNVETFQTLLLEEECLKCLNVWNRYSRSLTWAEQVQNTQRSHHDSAHLDPNNKEPFGLRITWALFCERKACLKLKNRS